MRYQVYQAAGWHGEPSDPLLMETDDERRAAMLAGERVDIKMPGGSNRYPAYAVNAETGERLERIESYICDRCGELTEWGDGPQGIYNGRIHGCPASLPKHLVTWVCDDCALGDETDD